MQQIQKLHWTPCAICCIDLMLEHFEKKILIHHETLMNGKEIIIYIFSRTSFIFLLHKFTKDIFIRPIDTYFVISYLNLRCSNEKRITL